MELLRIPHIVEYVLYAVAVAFLPDAASAQANTEVIKAPIHAVPYRLIDFLTLELILLGGLVLLALVLIARRTGVR